MVTITKVSNPVYSNVGNTTIDCLLMTKEMGQIPYTATANDSTTYGQQLYASLLAGTYGVIAPYVAPPPPPTPIPDLAAQLTVLLIAGTPITAGALNPVTLTDLNAQLAAAQQPTIPLK